MNAAYKHLEAKLRVGELTLAQWAALFVGVLTAILWGTQISPFGPMVTVFSACYIGGLPAAAIFLAATTDTDVVLLVRSAVGWRKHEGRFLAGAGTDAKGYVVTPDPVDDRRNHTGEELSRLNLEALWES